MSDSAGIRNFPAPSTRCAPSGIRWSGAIAIILPSSMTTVLFRRSCVVRMGITVTLVIAIVSAGAAPLQMAIATDKDAESRFKFLSNQYFAGESRELAIGIKPIPGALLGYRERNAGRRIKYDHNEHQRNQNGSGTERNRLRLRRRCPKSARNGCYEKQNGLSHQSCRQH
jgi:hypothetical protein